ncbi:MAG: UvrD-helicase domain-containing protein [Alphaproteobacteria bacterium]|nr:UvrD-helicase domain-containing protein [Alphaproteobacteria bacterium]
MDSLLENLNEKQRAAVITTDGPLLVLAGAGTGKTRVLTTRIAHILNMGLCMPWNVLALTFTNKAANEMKTRLSGMSSGAWFSGDVWCGTFHSICLRILRANHMAAGLQQNFLIYGEEDQKSVIKSLITSSTKQPADYVEEFSRIKDHGLIAYQSKDKLFNAYNAELARLNAVDFGDIILRVLKMFNEHPDILARYQNQFKYILVDEFQDTNSAQMELLCMLTSGVEKPNICCVGDDDQSIYSWRGAEIKHILDFQKTYPGAQIIRLETNYRSTSNILGAANSLIRHNRDRLGKELHNVSEMGAGEPVYVLTLPSDYDEVRIIADFIQRDETPDFSKFAVLIRTGSLSRLFEEEFGRRQIPYKLVGATKFYDRVEIRDVIAYLRLLAYPFDDMSFLRIIGKPSRQIGPKAIEKIKQSGPNLMAGLRGATLTAKQRAAADEFLSAFDFDWASMSPRDATKSLLDRVGYLKYWHESKDSNAQERLSNINELINGVIAKYDTVADFLEHAALMTADDNDAEIIGNVVSIMTIHAAKGLEFDTVFLPAWEENIFPNDKTVSEGAIEEERRLAYVAITRARRMCVISNAMSRVIFGQRQYNCPSRFITEIDNRYLDFQGGAPRARTYYATLQRPTYDAPPKPRPTPVQNNTLKGKFVTHSEMGSGVVIEDDGNILTVAFKNRGIKKVARQFVTVS